MYPLGCHLVYQKSTNGQPKTEEKSCTLKQPNNPFITIKKSGEKVAKVSKMENKRQYCKIKYTKIKQVNA